MFFDGGGLVVRIFRRSTALQIGADDHTLALRPGTTSSTFHPLSSGDIFPAFLERTTEDYHILGKVRLQEVGMVQDESPIGKSDSDCVPLRGFGLRLSFE